MLEVIEVIEVVEVTEDGKLASPAGFIARRSRDSIILTSEYYILGSIFRFEILYFCTPEY